MKMKNKQTSKYNVRRELVKLECQDCGADLEIQDEIYACCRFCGQKYIVNELLERIPQASGQRAQQSAKPRTTGSPVIDSKQVKKIITIWLIAAAATVVCWVFFLIGHSAKGITQEKDSLWDGEIVVSTQEKGSTQEYEGFRSETMKQVVSLMFEKPADEVTGEELESIKYFKVDSNGDMYTYYYSTEDYREYESDYLETLPDYTGYILFGYNKAFEDTIQQITLPEPEESWELIYADIGKFTGLTAINLKGYGDLDFSRFPHLTMIDCGWYLDALLETNLQASQIEVLSVADCALDGLEEFTSLKKLFIEGIDAEEMEHVVKCKTLDTLFCNYCFTSASYAPLKELTGLKSLYIDGGYNIKDLSVISSFTELENLSITCTDILNIGFVKDLKYLKTLRLSENSQLSNLDGLGDLQELEFLELNINSLYGEDPEYQEIGNLKNLKSLALHTVYELDFLYELDQLESLEVRLSFYNDLMQPIGQMKNLQELTLANTNTYGKAMENFALLQELPQLKKLTIEAMQFNEPVDEIFAVDGLEELRIISCGFEIPPTQVTISDTLKVLDLSGTHFGDYYNGGPKEEQEVLELYCEASTLEKLDLSFFDVTDLSVLNKLKSLKELTLYGCELTGIPENTFQGCERLETLDISMNQIADISFVKNLPGLRVIIMKEGYVTDLSPLLACPKLQYVDARQNPIAENPLTNVAVNMD